MSKVEAELDGITTEYDPDYGSRGKQGTLLYKIPCACCGKMLKRTYYTRSVVYLCDYCKKGVKKKRMLSETVLKLQTPKEKQFDNAVESIRKQVNNFDAYKKPIELARTKAELYGSIPETMVAVELLKLGYHIVPQQKIGKYRVDFAIPKDKLVIEVDGYVYHRDNYKGEREAIIQLSLGLDWKIIHIPAERIRKDIAKLKQVIETFR